MNLYTFDEKCLLFLRFSITHPNFSSKKSDYWKMAGSKCLNPFVIQTMRICVRKMCFLLCIIAYAERNLHFWRTTFNFDFLTFFTKTFIMTKIKTVATWCLMAPLKNIHLHLLYSFEHIKFNCDWEIEFQSKWFQ